MQGSLCGVQLRAAPARASARLSRVQPRRAALPATARFVGSDGPTPAHRGAQPPQAAGAVAEPPTEARRAPKLSPSGRPVKMVALDGNEACARVAYATSDVSFIYPITPATPMGEMVDQWSTEGRKNLFGNVMQVTEMESEAGVAGALHGALAAGALATSFTCSQGLLLMIPNMYKIAGELMPCVLHVSARALAGHALSIFGDHQASDVMAVRQTGWTMLSSHSVQEAQDLALAAHLATLAGSVPVVHFFDGFRTSHEINKASAIELIDPEDIKPLLAELTPSIAAHHERALSPYHPHQRGTAQGPDVYMQAIEAANPFHAAMPGIIQEAMNKVAAITGRQYHLFDYVGHPEAEHVAIAMGSGCEVLEGVVAREVKAGKKIGLVKVHLFRPWSAEHLLAALPKTVKRIAVMDRTKEHGSFGEPLLTEVAATVQRAGRAIEIIVGGRYGLGSKDFTPAMGEAVFDNLAQPLADVKDGYVVGIMDDVTFKSLSYGAEPEVLPPNITECIFWGMGSDGTVGANKEAVKIIASEDGMNAQAYFSYDAHKSGGVTVSHLRFGPHHISAPYLVGMAHYIGVHQMTYFGRFDTLAALRPGGTVLINAPWKSWEEVEKAMPPKTRARVASLRPKLYCIDAGAVAAEVGLGRRVNMVMQAAFFALSGVVDIDKARAGGWGHWCAPGGRIVQMNYDAVDKALERMVPIEIPAGWTPDAGRLGAAEALAAREDAHSPSAFLQKVVMPMLNMEGDALPVSPRDCTGCELCVHACPDNALVATPLEALLAQEEPNWDFFLKLPIRGDLFNKDTVRGSQFNQPLMEFSGACEGCGETPYMFGTRMLVANATGCSSIWGGSAPSNPYTCNDEGRGPAWANSLFEDNAQFGFGIALGLKQRRQAMAAMAKVKDNGALAATASKAVQAVLDGASGNGVPVSEAGKGALQFLRNNTDLLDKPSVWIIGGDGWAYDIGFGGVDHVLSTGEDVNILVLDTEEYSNTGGQKGYPDVYVASVALDANYNQARCLCRVIKAMAEAEAHPGPSLVLAYAPCAMHGMNMSESATDVKAAVDAGYWPLYRYRPGNSPSEAKLVLDSKKIKADLADFIKRENRFMVLERKDPETAHALQGHLEEMIHLRHDRLTTLADQLKGKEAPPEGQQ
eukprot:scaffold7.g3750.t1